MATFAIVLAIVLSAQPLAAQQESSPSGDRKSSSKPSTSSESSDDNAASNHKKKDSNEEQSEGESDYEFDSEEELFTPPESEEDAERAEQSEEAQMRRRDQVPLREMSKEEAAEAGFDFGRAERASERTSATLLAVTAGSLVHGVGHWYLDDDRTALFLVGGEAVGLAMAGTGVATWFARRETPAGAAIGSTLFHTGTGLFGLSYLIDVAGSMLGGQGRRSVNPRDRRGLALRTHYRYLDARGYPLNHHFRGGLEFTFDRLYAEATTDQEFGLGGSSYGAEFGVHWWRGERTWTFAYVEGTGEILDFREVGRFDRWSGALQLGLSLDLGLVAPHLEQVAVGLEGGYGRAWYAIGGGSAPFVDAAVASGYVPVELYSHFNFGERLHIRVAYEKSAMRPLQATRRLAGVGEMTMRYDSTDLLDLEVSSAFGGGFALDAGLVLYLW